MALSNSSCVTSMPCLELQGDIKGEMQPQGANSFRMLSEVTFAVHGVLCASAGAFHSHVEL
jgi:hypothetical protein